jgi:DNA end-binding protein Ku
MSNRSCGSGLIQIMHWTVAVKFYLAAASEDISFKTITKNGNSVKQQLVDSSTGEIVERDACLKGYEISKDNYIKFTPEEIKLLESERTNNVELQDFVLFDSVDFIYVEKSYYIKPDKGDNRGYKLLFDSLSDRNLIAIGKWMTRGKDQLVMIRPHKNGLIMHQMYYASEIRDFSPEEINPGKEISYLEKILFNKLIDKLSTEDNKIKQFNSGKYRNSWADRINEIARSKFTGESIKSSVKINENNSSGLVDMLTALQTSLEVASNAVKSLAEVQTLTKKLDKKDSDRYSTNYYTEVKFETD